MTKKSSINKVIYEHYNINNIKINVLCLIEFKHKKYGTKWTKIKIAVRAKRVTDILCRIYAINSVNIKKETSLLGQRFGRQKF